MSIHFAHQRLKPLAFLVALSTTSAFAQDVTFSLPEQPLADSVAQIGRQGQIHLIYNQKQLNGLRAPALAGNYNPQTALQKILIGSGLELASENGMFVIRPQNINQGTLVLPTTQVSGITQANPSNDVISAPQYVTAEEIRQRNTGDGNITDLMKTNPAVQFANSDSNSMNQGEIKPSRISIHGSSSYQNAYRLDGVSFNNDFDPADNGLGETSTRLSTSDQGIYIDSRLIDSMSVYDNNIPVEFGGFTGGTVDVSSRRWQGENSAHAYYRVTRSGWNKLFNDPAQSIDSSKNDTSNPARFQNKYNKDDFGGWFEVGVSENSGLVFSASRRNSTIPMTITGGEGPIFDSNNIPELIEYNSGTKKQHRTSDNFFLKYSLDVSDRTSVDLSTNYASYTSYMFSSKVMNSGYDSKHNGLGVTAVLKHKFDIGQLEVTANTQDLKDDRSNEQKYDLTLRGFEENNNYQMRESNSGGLGDLTSKQKNNSLKTVMRFDPKEDALGLIHSPTLGGELAYTKGTYQRDQDYFRYTYQGMIDKDDIYTGSLNNITRFQAGSYSANYTSYALFLDDNIEYGKLTLRPGVRLDRDDFVNQTNIAPRLSGVYDLFGDGSTQIIGGANRYYGRSMLTYALYGAQNGGMQNCQAYWEPCSLEPSKNDWDNQKDYEGMDSLKTPYNDELTAALQQEILSTTWRLQYVHREGYDEVRTRTKYNSRDADKKSIRVFDNGGRSSHDTVTLSVRNSQPWEWAQASHVMNAALTWQESKSNTPKDAGYSSFDPSNQVNLNKVWYDGKVIDASKLPSTSFNSPFKFNLDLTSVWDNYDLTWYNRLQWFGARNQAVRYDNSYYSDPENGQMRKYTKQHFGSRYTWDTRLGWKPDFAYGFGFSVEVNNVLNNKNVADRFVFEDRIIRSYDPGRQFWLQVNYDL